MLNHPHPIHAIVILVISCLMFVMLRKVTKEGPEHFIEAPKVTITSTTTDNVCKTLTDKMTDDDALKNVMQRKLMTVRNDGMHFRYFNDKSKPFNSDSEYCYVNTFDYVHQDAAPLCSKDNKVYNFPMIKDVQLGAVLDKGESVPQQVCIFQIDKEKVYDSDVRQFSTHVNNFDNSLVMDRVEQCASELKERTNQYTALLEEHKTLQTQNKSLLSSHEQCAAQTNMYVHQNTLLSAEVQAKTNIVLVDAYKIEKQLVIDLERGMQSIKVPPNFQVGYIFLPELVKVKIVRKDGVFKVFEKITPGYPKLESSMGDQAVQVDVILP